MNEHYVAHIRLEKVTRSDNRAGAVSNTGREVEEVTSLTCKGSELAALIDTVKGHLDLTRRANEPR